MVSFDTSVSTITSTTAYTVSAGAYPMLVVAGITTTFGSDLVQVLYDGQNLTSAFFSPGPTGSGIPGVSVWYTTAPTQGLSKNVVINVRTGGFPNSLYIASYLGAFGIGNTTFQSGLGGGGTGIVVNSPRYAQSWVGGTGGVNSTVTTTGLTLRQTSAGDFFGDSNAAAGSSYTFTYVQDNLQFYGVVGYEIFGQNAAAPQFFMVL